MHRSSESIAAPAAVAGQGPGDAHQSAEVVHRERSGELKMSIGGTPSKVPSTGPALAPGRTGPSIPPPCLSGILSNSLAPQLSSQPSGPAPAAHGGVGWTLHPRGLPSRRSLANC
jgi:hypothetical protein